MLRLFLTMNAVFLMTITVIGHGQAGKSFPIVFILKPGSSVDGRMTSEWQAAISDRHNQDELAQIMGMKRTLTEEETLWADLVKRKVPAWSDMVDSLRIPFEAIIPPDTITVLLGNLGGEDAFVYSYSTICFDLNKLHHHYGPASARMNSGRIDRFFAHEFTHVLHKVWRKKKGLEFDSPYEHALWECLTEGLGNYRSLSDKWIKQNGELTQHAREALERLQPIFVERISALQHANEEQAAPLMQGLSTGAFDQKWGALPVALWLAQEAKGDDGNLRKWVEAGPAGVLMLAREYLPENLKHW